MAGQDRAHNYAESMSYARGGLTPGKKYGKYLKQRQLKKSKHHKHEMKKQKHAEHMKRHARHVEKHQEKERKRSVKKFGYDRPIKEKALTFAAKMGRKEREEGRERGRKYADEVLGRKYQGLSPAQRQSMEESATVNRNREIQGYQRQLAGEQGRKGIKGGAAFAQREQLARAGMQNAEETHRDLNSLNEDLALKKMAAAFNIEQGEAAQSSLDRQTALDEARYEQERRRQHRLEEQYNRLFSRV